MAVEPQKDVFARLSYNIAQNPFHTVKAVACAVADKTGELTLFIDPATGANRACGSSAQTRARRSRCRR